MNANEYCYRVARDTLNVDSDCSLRRFLNADGFMTVESVKKELMDGYETPESEAQEWAERWVREPRNALHIDPFSVYADA